MQVPSRESIELALSLYMLHSGLNAPIISEKADTLQKKSELEEIVLLKNEIVNLKQQIEILNQKLDQTSKKEVRMRNACNQHKKKARKVPTRLRRKKVFWFT